MDNFSISLQDLCHGWATIKFENDGKQLVYTVSYITSDALLHLVYSALSAIQNKPYQTRFYLEPDYLSYEVKPCDGELCILVGDAGFSCGIKRYAREILKIFDSYLFSHGKEEYITRWYCDYPENAIEKLREQLQKAT